ncbi:MAG: magnesium chelatase, partial [Thermoprotei archaeon]
AKTMTARVFARLIGGEFRRVQCTPDLLPSDILGGYVYNQARGEYVLRKGPIFANVVFMDEINRLSPRTQSAFIQALQEGVVSIEGTTLRLPRPFLAVATRITLIEEEGVYPLSYVLIDRFMFSLEVPRSTLEEEAEVLARIDALDRLEVRQVMTPEQLVRYGERARRVTVAPEVRRYVVRLVERVRRSEDVRYPPSARASISIYKGARALAVMHGRSYVIPDDVKAVAPYALRHRVVLKPEAELAGVRVEDLIREALESVPVPR